MLVLIVREIPESVETNLDAADTECLRHDVWRDKLMIGRVN
jgi:hypothetical protein